MRPSRFSAARRPLRVAIAGAIFALTAAWSATGAIADPATEQALRTFVSAVDASPDWNASFKGITSDPSGATVLSGLKVVSAVPGMTFDVDTLTVTKGTAGNDGRYAATKIVAGTLGIAAGPLAVSLSNVSLDDFAVPGGIGFVFDPAKPFSSVVRAYTMLAKAHLATGRAASLAVTETLANATSRVTYNDITLNKLDGGRITTLSAGPLVMESPIPDKVNPKPLVTIKVGRADAKDIDLGGLLRVYDPPPAGGNRAFAPAIANVTYKDAIIQLAPRDPAPGAPTAAPASVTVRLGSVSLDDLRVRPPGHAITDDLDKSISKPFDETSGDPAGMINLLSAYSVGKLNAGPIDVAAAGIDTLHLDGMSFSALSLDGVGEFALTGFNAGVKDVASLKASRIAIGGMAFPKSDVLTAGLRTALTGGDVNLSAIAPTVGFVELGGFDANITGIPPQHLGKVRLDFANPIGNIPTSVKFDVSDVALDAILLPEPLRSQLTKYGYTKLSTALSGKIAWDEAKKQTLVTGLKLDVKDVGAVTIDAVLNGPTRPDFEKLDKVNDFIALGDKVTLSSGSLVFKDDSITNRVINNQATEVKVEPDKFRDQFARGLPFMLLPVGSPDFQKKASPALQDFIRAPGTLTIAATPAMPVAIPALVNAAKGSGLFSLPTLLNLAISSMPGAKPATPPPAPGTPPTPAPAAPAPAPAAGSSVTPATPPAPK